MSALTSPLTAEQRARIERNRQEALAKRARLQQQQQQQPTLQLHGGRQTSSGTGQSPPPYLNRQLHEQPSGPAHTRPAPQVAVVTIDAHEAAIIEQAMMAAQRLPHLRSQEQEKGPFQQQQQKMSSNLPAQENGRPDPRPMEQQQQQQQQKQQQHQPRQHQLQHQQLQPADRAPNSQQQQTTSTAGGPPITVSLVVQNEGMFKAACGYHEGVIKAFRTIKSKTWDASTRTWSFHVRDHDELVKKLSEVGGVTVKALPSNVIKALNSPSNAGAGSTGKDNGLVMSEAEAESKLQDLPPDLLSVLMPFQREGVKFAVTHGGRALIGDEMGLGKTLQGISIAKVYEREWPCLIVVPSALRLVWKHELLKWLPDLDEEDVSVVMKGNDLMHGRITVISYELLAVCHGGDAAISLRHIAAMHDSACTVHSMLLPHCLPLYLPSPISSTSLLPPATSAAPFPTGILADPITLPRAVRVSIENEMLLYHLSKKHIPDDRDTVCRCDGRR